MGSARRNVGEVYCVFRGERSEAGTLCSLHFTIHGARRAVQEHIQECSKEWAKAPEDKTGGDNETWRDKIDGRHGSDYIKIEKRYLEG